MTEFNLFKIQYDWYEGEHYEILVGKKVSVEDFEKDLIRARKFAEELIGKEIKSGDYLGKGYGVECLPQFYGQILWYLTNELGYLHCYYDQNVWYDVDDDYSKNIMITKLMKNIDKVEVLP